MRKWLIVKLNGKPDSGTPIGYWVKGAGKLPEVGKPMYLEDIQTSKGERFDWYSTTEVKEVDMTSLFRGEFITSNSTWSFREI